VSWSSDFVELDKKHHDRISFDCDVPELNEFLLNRAARHMAAGISRTMVLPATTTLPGGKSPICSFYTIAPGSIERQTLVKDLAKKLPHYPVPVFLLAQLAVDTNFQSQGLGKATLVKALEHLRAINTQMKAYAVIVDCVNEKAEQFYQKFGFEFLSLHNGRVRLFMPMRTVILLFE
jgi:GNAT superfamily N-acetyltransferase